MKIKYPVKIGYSDKSGKNENIITDSNNNAIVYGQGDCCKIGGIQDRKIALLLVKLLNKHGMRNKQDATYPESHK